jgi:hypothetical protein
MSAPQGQQMLSKQPKFDRAATTWAREGRFGSGHVFARVPSVDTSFAPVREGARG